MKKTIVLIEIELDSNSQINPDDNGLFGRVDGIVADLQGDTEAFDYQSDDDEDISATIGKYKIEIIERDEEDIQA